MWILSHYFLKSDGTGGGSWDGSQLNSRPLRLVSSAWMLGGFFLEFPGSVPQPGNVFISIGFFFSNFYGTCLVLLIGRYCSLYILGNLNQKQNTILCAPSCLLSGVIIFPMSDHLRSPLKAFSPLFTFVIPAFLVCSCTGSPKVLLHVGGKSSTRTL